MTIDVDKIAQLAALEIKADDKALYEHDLANILALIEQMDQVDVGDAAPMAHPLAAKQALRIDKVTADITSNDQFKKLQNLSKNIEAGLYLVPQVIE